MIDVIDANEMLDLLKFKDDQKRLFYYYWAIMEHDGVESKEMARLAIKNHKGLNKKLISALKIFKRNLSKDLKNIDAIVKTLDKYSTKYRP